LAIVLLSQNLKLIKSAPRISAVFLSIVLVFCSPVLVSLIFFSPILFFLVMVSPVLLAALITILSRLAKAEFVVTEQDIVFSRRLFNFRFAYPFSTKRRYAWRLTLTPGRLELWAGTQRFEFSGSWHEMSWLAYELSDWLRLPIERE
jgi:hypothetical protein